MSATPIPRTLAQTIYADLDVSVIDELPPGRTPVQTVVLSNERRHGLPARPPGLLGLHADRGELRAAGTGGGETYRQLREELPDLRVGLVHGRLKAAEKEEAQMRAFQSGVTQLLVATTVIEVGVDVPNASIADHRQRRAAGPVAAAPARGGPGRRGATASQCLLMYQQPPLGEGSRARLDVMRTTTDGFVIAQKDLELRGPGELLGRRQTGLIGMKIADPVRDAALIPACRSWRTTGG
ncbi:hypothetical protein OUZ56_018691 [Daphnia magna]|uniref:Helicase C-terminal domain-containing protein n=1 Tax=Daphnia magna TaxID=35525 RepID=A0ABQ9Z9J6_9CRUS|nr:hypothetical protein OUZ56_018691 [Daphnia magna]